MHARHNYATYLRNNVMTSFNHQGCTAPPALTPKLCVWANLIPSPSLAVKKKLYPPFDLDSL